MIRAAVLVAFVIGGIQGGFAAIDQVSDVADTRDTTIEQYTE